MSKYYRWKVPIDGKQYDLYCEENGSKYDLYLDDVHLVRAFGSRGQQVEENVVIGGKVCQLVVYDYVPDICVDGILVGAAAEEVMAQKRSRRNKMIIAALMMAVATLVIFSYFLMTMAGEEILGGVLTLVFAFLMAGVGVILLLSGLRQKIDA